MATSMEADSEVHFKERQEGKGVKTETAVDDATLQFEFRASTPAASPSGRGAEHRGGDAKEPRRIELKKFSLRPEKYDGKVDFESWVNQFEEYATLGQWTEEEKSSSCRAPETRQAARSNACGSSGDVSRDGRAGMDDDGTA